MNIEKIKFPVVEVKTNTLSKEFGHYNYEQRLVNVINILKNKQDKKISEFFNYPVYKVNSWVDINNYSNVIDKSLDDIYTIKPITSFIGVIPEINQKEIKNAMDVLKKHPFLKLFADDKAWCQTYTRTLYVLAPKNNFASENNIKGIDPIVFVLCTNIDEHGYTNYYLIPVTQWV